MDEFVVFNMTKGTYGFFGPKAEHVFYNASTNEICIQDSVGRMFLDLLNDYEKDNSNGHSHFIYLGALDG